MSAESRAGSNASPGSGPVPSPATESESEAARLRSVYAAYHETGQASAKWSPDIAGNRLILEEREQRLRSLFERAFEIGRAHV